MTTTNSSRIHIVPTSRIALPNWIEVYAYRELLLALAIRDLKIRYRQTLLGALWAILQPFITMIVFTFLFGYIARFESEGVPYAVFSFSGLILWYYFANSLNTINTSVVSSAGLFTKVYFPRLVVPLAASLVGILDYFIALCFLLLVMTLTTVTISPLILAIPLVMFGVWLFTVGLGMFVSALNVRYRDLGYLVPFGIQVLMYLSPVIYPLSIAPNYRHILELNPLSIFLELHRAIILQTSLPSLTQIFVAFGLSLALFFLGSIYFRSVERQFADII